MRSRKLMMTALVGLVVGLGVAGTVQTADDTGDTSDNNGGFEWGAPSQAEVDEAENGVRTIQIRTT